MDVQKQIDKYSEAIWKYQLPHEEEMFLYDLMDGKKSTNYKYSIDSDYSLYLAYNASKHKYEGYDEEQIRSLKEILNLHHVRNLMKLPSMAKVFRLMNAAGIIPVLVKGAALMCYYAPDIPRMMGDIDLYIAPEHFDEALTLLYDNGFEFVSDTGYHVAVTSKNLDIDVHRYIYKNGGDKDSGIYERLIQCTFLGCDVCVLSPEDMLLHQLANRGLDICTCNHVDRHFKWIVDCRYIMNFCSPGIGDLIGKANEVNNLYYTQLTLTKFVALFPELFADKYPEISDKKYLKWIKCAEKIIAINEKYSDKNAKGLKYIISYRFCDEWNKAKMEKIFPGRDGTVLGLMLKRLGISSAGDFKYRLRRVVKESKKGVNSDIELADRRTDK